MMNSEVWIRNQSDVPCFKICIIRGEHGTKHSNYSINRESKSYAVIKLGDVQHGLRNRKPCCTFPISKTARIWILRNVL